MSRHRDRNGVDRPPTAPDGKPYPPPVVAVSKEEQRPWTFGWKPSADRERDRMIVHAPFLDPASDWTRRGNQPFYLVSVDLPEADYVLMRPNPDTGEQEPALGYAGVERKENDAASSMTAHHDRFEDECDRLRMWHAPLIVLSTSVEVLLERNPRHAASMLGTMMVICADHRIPIMALPSRSLAERFAGDFLRRKWEAALAVNPDWLAWAREYELRAEQARLQVVQDMRDRGAT